MFTLLIGWAIGFQLAGELSYIGRAMAFVTIKYVGREADYRHTGIDRIGG
jgi:hypothetical protein